MARHLLADSLFFRGYDVVRPFPGSKRDLLTVTPPPANQVLVLR
jgi:hypothetical protein